MDAVGGPVGLGDDKKQEEGALGGRVRNEWEEVAVWQLERHRECWLLPRTRGTISQPKKEWLNNVQDVGQK